MKRCEFIKLFKMIPYEYLLSLWMLLGCSDHFLGFLKRSPVHFELWIFDSDFIVSFQQNYNCNLAFEEGQVLSDAGSLS
jgi:hypothetical protein